MNGIIYDISCKHCGRFLGKAESSTTITLKCSNSSCKKLDTYKIVFLSDMMTNGHSHIQPDNKEKEIAEMKEKLSELDGRTKEAKDLKAQISDMEKYIEQLEGIIDGQG